jgi:hypothetical protein
MIVVKLFLVNTSAVQTILLVVVSITGIRIAVNPGNVVPKQINAAQTANIALMENAVHWEKKPLVPIRFVAHQTDGAIPPVAHPDKYVVMVFVFLLTNVVMDRCVLLVQFAVVQVVSLQTNAVVMNISILMDVNNVLTTYQ